MVSLKTACFMSYFSKLMEHGQSSEVLVALQHLEVESPDCDVRALTHKEKAGDEADAAKTKTSAPTIAA